MRRTPACEWDDERCSGLTQIRHLRGFPGRARGDDEGTDWSVVTLPHDEQSNGSSDRFARSASLGQKLEDEVVQAVHLPRVGWLEVGDPLSDQSILW